MDKRELPPQLRNLSEAELAAAVEFAKANPDMVPGRASKPKDLDVKNTPIEQVAKYSEALPEGHVDSQILSPETSPQTLSIRSKLENMLNDGISGTEAREVMEQLMKDNQN